MSPEEPELSDFGREHQRLFKGSGRANLVTLNGQPASFLAGGEFPVPTAVGIGGVSGINTQFRSFGTN